MATLVAVDINQDQVSFVSTEPKGDDKLNIVSIDTFELADLFPGEREVNEEEGTEEGVNGIAAPQQVVPRSYVLEQLLEREVDSTVAVLPSDEVLFEKISLPFKDQKRLEQVVPLQEGRNRPKRR